MKTMRIILRLLIWACFHPLAEAMNLNITAIGSQNGASTLECWEVETPFNVSTTPGINGSATVFLGNVANMTYAVIPPGLDGGYHNAAYRQ